MHYPSKEIEQLYTQAMVYDQRGDAYNAIKLFKRIIKVAPDWVPPYAKLGSMYKYRQDWKAALHYNKKAVALDPSNRTCWWDKGIAATALKKPRIAKRIWAKFGLPPQYEQPQELLSIRLAYDKQFEILWACPVAPALAVLTSIPHPISDRRFHDLVLFDGKPSGYSVVEGKRYAVFDELGIFKRSTYKTFSAVLLLDNTQDLLLLEGICQKNGLGFENWSNAAKVFLSSSQNEVYGPGILPRPSSQSIQVAIAAPGEEEVLQVLQSWAAISLSEFTALTQHN